MNTSRLSTNSALSGCASDSCLAGRKAPRRRYQGNSPTPSTHVMKASSISPPTGGRSSGSVAWSPGWLARVARARHALFHSSERRCARPAGGQAIGGEGGGTKVDALIWLRGELGQRLLPHVEPCAVTQKRLSRCPHLITVHHSCECSLSKTTRRFRPFS